MERFSEVPGTQLRTGWRHDRTSLSHVRSVRYEADYDRKLLRLHLPAGSKHSMSKPALPAQGSELASYIKGAIRADGTTRSKSAGNGHGDRKIVCTCSQGEKLRDAYPACHETGFSAPGTGVFALVRLCREREQCPHTCAFIGSGYVWINSRLLRARACERRRWC